MQYRLILPMKSFCKNTLENQQIYFETCYRILCHQQQIDLYIPEISLFAHEWLKQLPPRKEIEWAVITACNPQGQYQNSTKNQQAQTDLETVIKSDHCSYYPAMGLGRDLNWRPEASWFVWQASQSTYLNWARQFNQAAIVYGRTNTYQTLSYLIWI